MDRLAFDYAYEPDLTDADSYDLFVTDPDGTAHKVWGGAPTKFYAYLSWYEIGPTDPYLTTGRKLLKEAQRRGVKVLADNPRWKSKIMDVSNPDWQALFLELVADAAGKGYAGIYFDTWDAWGDVKNLGPKKKEKLMAANVEILRMIRAEHLKLDLMLNRGWEVMRPCSDYASRLLVESVWSSHDGLVGSGETAGMIKRIQRAQGLGYEVNILDYMPSGDVVLAKDICRKASAIDCGCTVLRGSLTSPEVLAVSP